MEMQMPGTKNRNTCYYYRKILTNAFLPLHKVGMYICAEWFGVPGKRTGYPVPPY